MHNESNLPSSLINCWVQTDRRNCPSTIYGYPRQEPVRRRDQSWTWTLGRLLSDELLGFELLCEVAMYQAKHQKNLGWLIRV